MKPLHASALVLGIAATQFACASTDAERVATGEAPIAVAHLNGICGNPVSSDDGAFVVVDSCSAGGEVLRIEVGTGRMERVTNYPFGVRVRGMGTRGKLVYYLTESVEDYTNGWSVVVSDFSLDAPARRIHPAFPEGTSDWQKRPPAVDEKTFVATNDGRYIAFVSGSGSRFLTVADLRSDAPPTLFDLGESYQDRWLAAAPDGTHLLLLQEPSVLGSDANVRRVELAAASSLGPQVAIPLHGATLMGETYDGTSLLATGRQGNVPVFAKVDASTAATSVLADNAEHVELVAMRDGAVWYTATRFSAEHVPTHSIERVPRNGSAAPTVFASTEWNGGYSGQLSHDGTTLLFSHRALATSELFSVPAHGSSSPVRVAERSGGFGWRQSSPGRVLAENEQTMVVLDDKTGATIGEWGAGFGVDAADFVLSGDGSSVYQARSCTLGTVRGTEVVRLTGAESVLLPCSLSGFHPDRRFARIKNSPSVLYLIPDSAGQRYQATLLNP